MVKYILVWWANALIISTNYMILYIVSRGGLRVACEATGSKWWQRLSREDLVIRVSHKDSEGERLCNSYCYRFTAWKNIFQNYGLINSLEFFFYTYELYNEGLQCILHSSHFFKLLLSKILLFSHFVGEPNYWSVESPKK